jgi:hypothetical protein
LNRRTETTPRYAWPDLEIKLSASAHQAPGNNFFSTSRHRHAAHVRVIASRHISGPHSVPDLHTVVKTFIAFWPQPVSPSTCPWTTACFPPTGGRFPSLLRHGRFGLRIEYQLRRLLSSSTDPDCRSLRLALVSSVQYCMRKSRANTKIW